MGWYQVTVSIVTGLGLVACIAFCTDYFLMTQKRRVRRSQYWYLLMAWPTALGALLLYIFIARLIGPSTVRQIVGLVVFSSLLVMVPWLHVLMRKSMARPEEGEVNEPT